MMKAIGREDLVGPDYAHNHHRVEKQAEIEGAISAWTQLRTPEQVEEVLRVAGVPCGQVFSVKEVVENPHTQARGLVEDVWVGTQEHGWNVKMPKVTPVLEGCDAKTRWAGPELGQHNHEVLVHELGLSEAEFQTLQEKGIVGN
jgi:crotonobetainyl-CoA:carnitine CoA-transferase CaiB-like acyl-CoA transferase